MDFSLGLIEIQALGHAILVLDTMTKAADVEFVSVERKLGGRLVTLVVKGKISAVNAAIDAGSEVAKGLGCLKAAEVIARPHPEILKFLHLDEEEKKVNSETAATHVGPVAGEKKVSEKVETAAPKKEKTAPKAAEKESSKTAKAVSDKPAQKRAGRKKSN